MASFFNFFPHSSQMMSGWWRKPSLPPIELVSVFLNFFFFDEFPFFLSWSFWSGKNWLVFLMLANRICVFMARPPLRIQSFVHEPCKRNSKSSSLQGLVILHKGSFLPVKNGCYGHWFSGRCWCCRCNDNFGVVKHSCGLRYVVACRKI